MVLEFLGKYRLTHLVFGAGLALIVVLIPKLALGVVVVLLGAYEAPWALKTAEFQNKYLDHAATAVGGFAVLLVYYLVKRHV